MSDTHNKTATGALALAALGVVYGDIGTSPLYAFKEAFAGTHGMAPTEPNVLAALSALFWAMMLIISVKYVWIMLKFDNNGEGGVLALTALANRSAQGSARWKLADRHGGYLRRISVLRRCTHHSRRSLCSPP